MKNGYTVMKKQPAAANEERAEARNEERLAALRV